MEFWGYLLVVIGIIVLPYAGFWLKRRLVRKADAIGAERWDKRQAAKAGSGGLGDTILLQTDPTTARMIIEPAVLANKRVRAPDENTWALTIYGDDDVTVGAVPVAGGVEVRVLQAVEFVGTVNGMKQWKQTRERIATSAAERAVPVVQASGELVRTAENAAGSMVWRHPAHV